MRTILIGVCLLCACSFDGAPSSELPIIDAAPLQDSTPSNIDAAEPDATSVPVCAPVPAGIVAWWEGEVLGVDREASFPASSLQGNPSPVTGLVGDAIRYGFDDFLRFSPAPIAATFSIEAWIFPTANQSDYRTIYAAYFGSGLFIKNNQVVFYDVDEPNNNGDVATGSTVIPNNEWTHLAATWNGTTVRLYVNGLEDVAVASSTVINLPNPGYSGGVDDGPLGDEQIFGGLVDELSIYSRELPPSEILAIAEAQALGKCKE